MDPREYHATWVANKAIYRTRMALADGGRLIVMAPGVSRFGEDEAIDGFIRRVGYRGTEEVLRRLSSGSASPSDLTAASHIIVSSPEGRFRLTYAAGMIGASELEAVGLEHADCARMLSRYDPEVLREGSTRSPTGKRCTSCLGRPPACGSAARQALERGGGGGEKKLRHGPRRRQVRFHHGAVPRAHEAPGARPGVPPGLRARRARDVARACALKASRAHGLPFGALAARPADAVERAAAGL